MDFIYRIIFPEYLFSKCYECFMMDDLSFKYISQKETRLLNLLTQHYLLSLQQSYIITETSKHYSKLLVNIPSLMLKLTGSRRKIKSFGQDDNVVHKPKRKIQTIRIFPEPKCQLEFPIVRILFYKKKRRKFLH